MASALVIGARNLGFAIIERLLADGWDVAGGAVSAGTIDRVRGTGAHAVKVDVTDQASVLAALEEVGARFGRVDLVVNAASPYAGGGGGPFGGGTLAESDPDGFERWASSPARGAYGALSASARFLKAQGGPATVIQVTGGSSRRAMPGRGLWAAGAFGVRALTQAAALELREEGIHVALLIVDAGIDRSGEGDARTADQPSIAGAVAYLASQSPRAMTHELQVTPALDNWTP
ncbi:MAG TPA: SDR family oxidoreductase [Solirubrobacteraceae bacterium]|jgi:NAD(P)-dependent dehydrogenase (short-subunit alcohol dehydrogenase family)|nr:SDR family oxidoreductase [Solirubrobacteraceae bacterium]